MRILKNTLIDLFVSIKLRNGNIYHSFESHLWLEIISEKDVGRFYIPMDHRLSAAAMQII